MQGGVQTYFRLRTTRKGGRVVGLRFHPPIRQYSNCTLYGSADGRFPRFRVWKFPCGEAVQGRRSAFPPSNGAPSISEQCLSSLTLYPIARYPPISSPGFLPKTRNRPKRCGPIFFSCGDAESLENSCNGTVCWCDLSQKEGD